MYVSGRRVWSPPAYAFCVCTTRPYFFECAICLRILSHVWCLSPIAKSGRNLLSIVSSGTNSSFNRSPRHYTPFSCPLARKRIYPKRPDIADGDSGLCLQSKACFNARLFIFSASYLDLVVLLFHRLLLVAPSPKFHGLGILDELLTQVGMGDGDEGFGSLPGGEAL